MLCGRSLNVSVGFINCYAASETTFLVNISVAFGLLRRRDVSGLAAKAGISVACLASG